MFCFFNKNRPTVCASFKTIPEISKLITFEAHKP